MSLPRHLLALTLILAPVVGCDVEDADDKDVPTPAPAEPTQPNRPVPQPQVSPGGQARQLIAIRSTRPAVGPGFAPSIA